MKKSLAILSSALLSAMLFAGCGRPSPKIKPAPAAPAPAASKPAPASPAAAKPAPDAGGVRQGVKEAAGVADYAIGAAQIQTGQKLKNKVGNISQQHNKELEDALK